MIGINAWGDTATFDFTSSSTASLLGVTPSNEASKGVSINDKSITDNTISCAFSRVEEKTDPVFFTKSDGTSYQARIYVGGIITLSAPTGYVISGIEINGANLGAAYLETKTGTYTTGSWTGESQYVVLSCIKSTAQINSITVTFAAAAAVSAPVFSVPAGSFLDTQSVELSCSTEGATIYYTTDGSTPDNTSNQYSSAISVSSTTTIKAIAYKGSSYSNVAEATYTLLTPYESLAAAHSAAEATGTTKVDCAFTFNDVLVTGVYNNNAYIVDENGDAAVIYTSGHGFAVGDKISGTAVGQMQIYQTYALELIGFKKTTTGLSVTSGNTVTPIEKSLADITTADLCKLIKVYDVQVTTSTYSAGNTKVTDGTNEVILYNYFNTIGDMKFSTEAYYTITGIVPAYSKIELAPRTADDVVCNLVAPDVSFPYEILQVPYDVNSVSSIPLSNNGGTPTYSSSDESVATIDASTGSITLVAPGVTTITATTAENSTYLSGNASYKLLWLTGDGSEEHPYNAVDLNNVTGLTTGESMVWVSGKILGSSAKTGTGVAEEPAATNIAIGDDQDNPSLSNTITVAVVTALRSVLDLTVDNSVIGQSIKVYGRYNNNYYKRCGLDANASQKISGLAADLNVSSEGYATYYDDAAWVVPEGLTAKYVSAAEAGHLTWKEYEAGSTVPAKTGVVVSGEANDYPITYIGAGTSAPTNLLKGSVTSATTEGGDKYYMLSLDSDSTPGSVGFYYGQADGGAFTNGAHKAYLALTSEEAGSKSAFLFNDDVTTISSVNATTENGVMYNLAGQRVNSNAKGIVIMNGKKMVVK